MEKGAIGSGDILQEFFGVGIILARVAGVVATKQLGQKLCGSGNGQLCLNTILLKLLDIQEILDKRMVLARDPAREAQ